ncbi:hypothetical protein MMC34_008414 [Xylographa carneopallida]|nr:hypothetical protein [Xylographa carneopallida]
MIIDGGDFSRPWNAQGRPAGRPAEIAPGGNVPPGSGIVPGKGRHLRLPGEGLPPGKLPGGQSLEATAGRPPGAGRDARLLFEPQRGIPNFDARWGRRACRKQQVSVEDSGQEPPGVTGGQRADGSESGTAGQPLGPSR